MEQNILSLINSVFNKKDSCDFDRFLSIVLEKFTPYSMYVKLLLSMKFLRKGAGNYEELEKCRNCRINY